MPILDLFRGKTARLEAAAKTVLDQARTYRSEAITSMMHDGMNSGPERTDAPILIDDPWQTLTPTVRRQFMGLARWLFINDGFTRGAIGKMARYSFPLIPQADTESNAVNDAYEAYFREVWAPQADAFNLHSFWELQGMWSKAVDVDGDIGILFRRDRNDILRVASIEGHLIGPRYGGEELDWHDGVRVGRSGIPIQYRVTESTPRFPYFAYAQGREVDVQAADMILLTEANRVRQYRGISALEAATTHLRDKRDILGFEKVGVKTHSAWAAALENPLGEEDPWEGEAAGSDSADAPSRAAMVAGQIPMLSKGQKLQLINSNRPSPAFTGFLEFLLRDVAEGLGLPLEFVWRTDATGPAQRAILAQAQRRFKERQDRFIEKALNRIWAVVIADAIAKGLVPSSNQFARVKWQRPPEITIDGGREAQQDRDDVAQGLMTRAEHFGRRGMDWYSEAHQLEREADDLLERANRLAKKHGITTEAALNLLAMKTPNGNQPGEKEEKKPDPKKKEVAK